MTKPARSRALPFLVLCLALGAAAGLRAEEARPRNPVDDVLRLWNAKLSEDFIRRHVQGSGQVYDLSVDEKIKKGVFEGSLSVKTNDTAKGEIKIPLKGTIL